MRPTVMGTPHPMGFVSHALLGLAHEHSCIPLPQRAPARVSRLRTRELASKRGLQALHVHLQFLLRPDPWPCATASACWQEW